MRGYVLDADSATWKHLAAEYEQKKSELDQARRDAEGIKADAQKQRDEFQKLQDSVKDRHSEIARLTRTIAQLEHDLASPGAEREMGEGTTWQLVPNRWVLGVQAITPQSVLVNLGNVNQNTAERELTIGDIVRFPHASEECVITLLGIEPGVVVFVKKSAKFAFKCH